MRNDLSELRGTKHVFPTSNEVCLALAERIALSADSAVERFGDFHLAISGGGTPQPLYELLALDRRFGDLPWEHTHIWWVDERRVPMADVRSNFGGFKREFGNTRLAEATWHPMCTSGEEPAVDYWVSLQRCLARRHPTNRNLDFVSLGVGNDGHTASLFPESAALKMESSNIVSIEEATAQPNQRMTMTFGLLNQARTIAILILGQGKRQIMAELCSDNTSVQELPILGIHPDSGDLHWYVDQTVLG